MTQKAMNEREGWRKALEDISAMTYDAWTNGARAKEIADAALSTPHADKVPAAEGASVEFPGPAMHITYLSGAQQSFFSLDQVRELLATPPAKLPQEAKYDWKKLMCRVINHAKETNCITEDEGLFLALTATQAPQPARAGAVDDAKDAARYRWLREQHQGHEDMQFDFEGFPLPQEPTALAWTVFKPDRGELVPVGCIVGELDDAIDAAIAAATTAATGEKDSQT